MKETPESSQQKPHKPSFGQVVMSTLAAAVGVQSDRNRQRDFSRGSFGAYIAAGVIFTTLFVCALVLVVKTVLANMG
ncbi:DUF2970 domain-containing protein [Microbulbifer discodermiae]|uniref:DUF2970 domain-containing protein n=1 Tax=Microbulbifer sp. 2201CG32-9 TaxID=3232309 RepID=UPI00345BBECD